MPCHVCHCAFSLLGEVLMLSGEAEVSTVAELSTALAARLSGGAPHLTVDLPGCSSPIRRRSGYWLRRDARLKTGAAAWRCCLRSHWWSGC